MSNFLFLKKNNGSLFNIISEAEKLFRDEYFEQSIIQVRRFAENLCKDLLQDKVSAEDNFDSMINKIKDNSFNNIRMKELADDLYFLKKHGNNSAHSSSANQNGKLALECLERAYEISVFYSNTKYEYNKKLDKTVFSEEMLMTGQKTGKKSSPKKLTEKYTQELKKSRTETSKKPSSKAQKSKIYKQKEPSVSKKGKFIEIFSAILITILMIAVYIFLKINNH